MRVYIPWLCAGCMLLGVIGVGARKAFFYAKRSEEKTADTQNRLSLLPYKIIGNYVIDPK